MEPRVGRQTRYCGRARGGTDDTPTVMTRTDASPSVQLLDEQRPLWWYGAVVFFIGGDLATTFAGLALRTVVEASPVVVWIIDTHGLWPIIPLKMSVVGGLYGIYRIVPHPHSIGIPLGLCALGFVVTVWNGAVIVAAAS